jgi:DNA uptake protein ComE-like DNA-binding protein
MFRYIALLSGLALAALAVFHPAPHPPQSLAASVATYVPTVPRLPAHRPRRRRRSRRYRSRHSGRSRRHVFNGTASVNRSDAALLGRVPGIGPAIAARIVELREREGAYTSLDQLLDVAGMSDSRLERASPYLTL